MTQVIRAERAPETCDAQAVWPAERVVFSQGYGQREASERFGEDPRIFSTDTIAFSGGEGAAAGAVAQVHIQDLSYDGGRHLVEGTEATIPAQLVLIAKGFTGANPSVFEAFGVSLPERSGAYYLCKADPANNKPAIFAAGDARLGSTLVVSAMADALDCAREIATRF